MSELRRVLRDRFGGSWDGAEHELHGLIELGGRRIKIELMAGRDGRYVANAFDGGTCVASESADTPEGAVESTILAARS